jgi:Phage tail assembly chaperone proteins, E, or 41 or 14
MSDTHRAANVASIATAQTPPKPEAEAAAKLELSKPIEAHGETITVINFREPTARDLLSIGNPVIFDPFQTPPKITHDEGKMHLMISTLGNIPPSSVQMLTTRDWTTCAWILTPFFLPVPGKT